MTTHLEPDLPAITPDQDDPTDAELSAYVGRRAAYYVERWSRGDRWGFNWAAFWLGSVWLAFRGLYRVVAAVAGVEMLAQLGLALLARGHLHDPDAPAIATLGSGVSLGVGVVLGQYANYWYYRQAERAVADARSRSGVESARLLILRRRGGTSWLRIAAVVPMVLLAFLAFGIALAAFGLRIPRW
jgi:hypothetical protein